MKDRPFSHRLRFALTGLGEGWRRESHDHAAGALFANQNVRTPAEQPNQDILLVATAHQRLQLFQAMWLREVQRMVESRCA